MPAPKKPLRLPESRAAGPHALSLCANPPAFPKAIGPGPAGMPQHACMGLNSCKGSDRFGARRAPGLGPNACAGQGYCATAGLTIPATSRTTAATRAAAGSTAPTRKWTSRATTIAARWARARRRSTPSGSAPTAPTSGKSVWAARARGVRGEGMAGAAQGAARPAGGRQGPGGPAAARRRSARAPARFAETGPTYLWISDDNTRAAT